MLVLILHAETLSSAGYPPGPHMSGAQPQQPLP